MAKRPEEVKIPAPSAGAGQALSHRTRQGRGTLRSSRAWAAKTSAAKILHRSPAIGKVNIPALSQRTRQGRGTLGVRIVERVGQPALDCETRDAKLLHGCSANGEVNIPALSQRTRQGRGTLGVRIVERVGSQPAYCSSRTFGSQRSM